LLQLIQKGWRRPSQIGAGVQRNELSKEKTVALGDGGLVRGRSQVHLEVEDGLLLETGDLKFLCSKLLGLLASGNGRGREQKLKKNNNIYFILFELP
jgi:hypothetical protein